MHYALVMDYVQSQTYLDEKLPRALLTQFNESIGCRQFLARANLAFS